MLKVEHVTKYYDKFRAVHDVSFEIHEGEIFVGHGSSYRPRHRRTLRPRFQDPEERRIGISAGDVPETGTTPAKKARNDGDVRFFGTSPALSGFREAGELKHQRIERPSR